MSAILDPARDYSAEIQAELLAAIANKTPVNIVGGGSKAFYGGERSGQPLSTACHVGILSYEPSELILTARAGTPLVEVEALLASQGQMLAFEPPHWGAGATLGGVVACGLAGPRRPYAGSVRDFVLGVKLLNGKGEMLRFGGEVIKNVAGFDLSRLMVGAMGTLGVLLEISLKVLPHPEAEATQAFVLPPDLAMLEMRKLATQPLPISATAYCDGQLHVRVSGSTDALGSVRRRLGGETLTDGEGASFWRDLREQRLPFFQRPGDLWRLSVPPAAPPIALEGATVTEWAGAVRWLKTDQSAEPVFAAAAASGGHATLFRAAAPGGAGCFQPLPCGLQNLHRRLKQAFDPHGIFNPGRLYPSF